MNQRRSVQEAKPAILRQHFYFTIEPAHYLPADTSGDVAAFEIDAQSGKYYSERKICCLDVGAGLKPAPT